MIKFPYVVDRELLDIVDRELLDVIDRELLDVVDRELLDVSRHTSDFNTLCCVIYHP